MRSTATGFIRAPHSQLLLASAVAAAMLAILLLPSAGFAQQFPNQTVSSYAGQTVSPVEVAGQPDVTFKDVQTDIPFKQGQPLKQTDVDAAVAALKQRTGVQDVTLDLEPEADGVRVVFILQPAIYVGMYEFPAALKNFSYSRLVQVANYNPQTPYSADDVQQAKDALVQFFRQHGYFLAEVRPEIQPVDNVGLVNIVSHTNLGPLAKIGSITLEGASSQETAYLQTKLRSVIARLRAASHASG